MKQYSAKAESDIVITSQIAMDLCMTDSKEEKSLSEDIDIDEDALNKILIQDEIDQQAED